MKEEENEEPLFIERDEDCQKFVRGMHGILALMFLVEMLLIVIVFHVPPIRHLFMVQFVTFYLFMVIFIIFYFVLLFCEWLRRDTKVNCGILIAFTIVKGLMLSTIAVYVFVVDGAVVEEVLIAIAGLFCVAIGITAIAAFCHFIDLEAPALYICATLIAVVYGAITITLVCFLNFSRHSLVGVFVVALFVLFFAQYMVCDTLRMMRDRHCCAAAPHEVVYAALTLWTDLCRPCLLALYWTRALDDPCAHRVCGASHGAPRHEAQRRPPQGGTEIVIEYPDDEGDSQ